MAKRETFYVRFNAISDTECVMAVEAESAADAESWAMDLSVDDLGDHQDHMVFMQEYATDDIKSKVYTAKEITTHSTATKKDLSKKITPVVLDKDGEEVW